jgi:hypothetical protein
MKPILERSWKQWARGIADGSSRAQVATVAACAVCGWIEKRSGLAPINAVAHVLYGDEAFGPAASTWTPRSVRRYTLPALAVNWAAMAGWAALFELLAPRGASASRKLAAGAGTSLIAWFVDYRLVPPRLTPGIEAHLSGRSIFWVYVALALAFAARSEETEE